MGSVVAAPLSAAATFLGGCCGTFAAGCCYRLAGSGQVGSAQAVRSVIVLLQAFTAALATVASATPTLWLPWACGRLRAVGAGDLGICGCSGDEACWADQLVYRAEAAGVAVFLALLLMAAGGCAEGASRSAAVAKFMAVPLIGFVLLFVGNDVLSTFGAFATVASAVFLAVQAVMLIDFAYAWNEDWYAKALEARRGARASSGFQGWQMGILVASALLLLGSIAGTICLLIAVPDARARSVTAVAWVLAAVLLVVSITEHVKHGALLTSCVVMAYNAWLTWEAMSLLPGGRGPELPAWASLSVCAVSLLLFSRRAGGADAAADQDGPDPAAGACGEAGSSARPPIWVYVHVIVCSSILLIFGSGRRRREGLQASVRRARCRGRLPHRRAGAEGGRPGARRAHRRGIRVSGAVRLEPDGPVRAEGPVVRLRASPA
ncbi:unnamed protein product [Prorocentrum cordatum]|uniref:Uncharacterized protein n=1 Tax=Prorocentrum cordatum TaxID=2364126 RepID=A0ABN9WFD8_9DINO|nr:unnamed protein product [Polarella glacialis]